MSARPLPYLSRANPYPSWAPGSPSATSVSDPRLTASGSSSTNSALAHEKDTSGSPNNFSSKITPQPPNGSGCPWSLGYATRSYSLVFVGAGRLPKQTDRYLNPGGMAYTPVPAELAGAYRVLV